jgi:hypothetical protein
MAKPALGRGLQHLMKERSAPTGQQSSPEKAQVTPGMAALLRGGNGESKEKPAADQPVSDAERLAAARKKKLVQASMFIADLLLMALIARLAFVSHGHFGFFEVTLCVLALAIGAWLSCLAIWMR